MLIFGWAVIALLVAVLSAPLYTLYAICRRFAVLIGLISPRGKNDISHVGFVVVYLILPFLVALLGACIGVTYLVLRISDGYWPNVNVDGIFTIFQWPAIENYTRIMEIGLFQLVGLLLIVSLGCAMVLLYIDLQPDPPARSRLSRKI